nr:hypothetical protein BSM_24850 [uncultured archaeon]
MHLFLGRFIRHQCHPTVWTPALSHLLNLHLASDNFSNADRYSSYVAESKRTKTTALNEGHFGFVNNQFRRQGFHLI